VVEVAAVRWDGHAKACPGYLGGEGGEKMKKKKMKKRKKRCKKAKKYLKKNPKNKKRKGKERKKKEKKISNCPFPSPFTFTLYLLCNSLSQSGRINASWTRIWTTCWRKLSRPVPF
jgi:hypothetical protein